MYRLYITPTNILTVELQFTEAGNIGLEKKRNNPRKVCQQSSNGKRKHQVISTKFYANIGG